MAHVVIEDQYQTVISRTWQTWGRTVVLGAVVGLTFWLLTTLIGQYIVEPIACKQVINAAACTNALPLAGNIATVLVAALAVVGMVRLSIARPIIVAVGAGALLWDLGGWTLDLFWVEAIAWSVLLYALVFALFGWITRYAALLTSLILSLLIVLIIRIALAL